MPKTYKVEVLTSTGSKVEIPVPVDTSMITLGNFQAYMEQEPIVADVEEKLEILEFEATLAAQGEPSATIDLDSEADSIALELAEYNLLISEARKMQLKAIIRPQHHDLLDRVAASQYPMILALLMLDMTKVDPLVDFEFHEGVKPDILYYQGLLKDSEARRKANITKAEVKLRLKNLSKGRMLAVPVAEVLFQSRIATDMVRGKWKPLPAPLQEIMDTKGIQYDQLRKALERAPLDTVEQKREKLNRENLLNSYVSKSDNELWQDAHRIIAHTTVPQNEEYNYGRAEARAEAMRNLPLDTARSLVIFFLEARRLSIVSTVTSSLKALTAESTR